MTPSDIDVLLHCYYSPSPHPRRNAPAVQEALARFVQAGMIELDPQYEGVIDGVYRTTSRGSAHVKQMCDLPWPVQAWVGADGKVIST